MATVKARGVGLNVQQLGQGDPIVVFVHGLVIDNLSSWYMTAASALSGNGTAVLYDLRGHGLSAQPKSGYRLEDSVLDLDALLGEIGLGDRPIGLAGNSFGGRIALAFATHYPERVERLMLVDSHPSDTDFTHLLRDTMALGGEAREQHAEQLFEAWLDEQRAGGSEFDAAYLEQLMKSKKSRTRRSYLSKMADLVFETTLADDVGTSAELTDADLERVNCPVLALFGERSDARDQGKRLVDLLPDCTLEIVEGCGHLILLDRPDVVRQALTRWFVRGRAMAEA